jgi:hypothetical protein
MVVAVVMLWAGSLAGAVRDVSHPFLFMNRRDVAEARRRVARESWAQQEIERMRQARGRGETFRNLLFHLVLDSNPSAEVEKEYLLSFVGARVDSRLWSDNYLHVLRYDALHDQLTPSQREDIRKTFRKHIEAELEAQAGRTYTRTNWLPNMQWPRPFSTFLMAVALKDEELIRRCFEAPNGWKYYFDRYVSDGRFYNEEFGKQYSMIGEMLLWCRGLEQLGLDSMGFGYRGEGGATMRSYLESLLVLGMGKVDLGTDRPHFPRLTIGDARGAKADLPGYAFQHSIVHGYLADGRGGNPRWMGSNMNGRDHRNRIVTKMLAPMWFEIAHARWPRAGFDYFLAQMRPPGARRYVPSLFFGLEPIDPDQTRPPAVASGVYPERGLAILRATEGRAFWDSPAPAVGLRMATRYVHEVPDSFALTGLYAFGRPIYLNRQVSAGYAGTDPGWSGSIRSHCSVMVDNQEPGRTDDVQVRRAFNETVKFVSIRSDEVYPGVDQERALLLTGEYLLDVFSLRSDRPRSYLWLAHTLGRACPDNPSQWAPTSQLLGSVYDLARERSYVAGDKPWAVTAVQRSCGADRDFSGLGERWFQRRVGVRMTMLGEEGTVAYTALGPVRPGRQDRLNHGNIEPGAPTFAAARSKPATMFVALHEPFEDTHRLDYVGQLARTDDAVAVHVRGDGIDDRILVRLGDRSGEKITLTGNGETFTFADHAHIRVGRDIVSVTGDLRVMMLVVGDARPMLRVNGERKPATFSGDYMLASLDQSLPAAVEDEHTLPARRGVLRAFWTRDLLRLATGGQGSAELVVRSMDPQSATGDVVFQAPEGLAVSPERAPLKNLKPGDEVRIPVLVRGRADRTNRLSAVTVGVEGATRELRIQPARLMVSQGMTWTRELVWPRDYAATVFGPRYVARYHYLSSVGATMLLDPKGQLRIGRGRRDPDRLPGITVFATGPDGKETREQVRLGGFQAFRPVLKAGKADQPAYLVDMGEHPHGYSSPLEVRFYEPWMVVRYKPGKKGQEIAMSFVSGVEREGPRARRQLPQLRRRVVAGRVRDVEPDRRGRLRWPDGPVEATFHRPTGYEYGVACFYPEGSRVRHGQVRQPAPMPMAFTYCRADEFAGLARRWANREPLSEVRPWGQGDLGGD